MDGGRIRILLRIARGLAANTGLPSIPNLPFNSCTVAELRFHAPRRPESCTNTFSNSIFLAIVAGRLNGGFSVSSTFSEVQAQWPHHQCDETEAPGSP